MDMWACVCSPMSPNEMFASFLWQRRNSDLCVLWLTFSKLGDCLEWLLTPERTSFSGNLSQFYLLPSFLLFPVGLMTSWPTCFLSTPPGAPVGEGPVGFLLWPSVLFFRLSLLGLFYFSLLTLKSSS